MKNVHVGALARHAAVAMGDFNSRVGTPHIKDKNGNMYNYRDVSDIVVNEHRKNPDERRQEQRSGHGQPNPP